MANVTISIDGELLQRARDYAASRGTSLNALIRTLLSRQVATPRAAVEKMIERLSASTGDSRGWRFDREQLQRGR